MAHPGLKVIQGRRAKLHALRLPAQEGRQVVPREERAEGQTLGLVGGLLSLLRQLGDQGDQERVVLLWLGKIHGVAPR